MPWTEPSEILDYWIGPDDMSPDGWAEKQKLWYAADHALDLQIRERFGTTLKAAENGELSEWKNHRQGQLALIVLFDQFSRNLYRGTADVYKNDPSAVDIADSIIESGELAALSVPASILVFHAYHHAEDSRRQNTVVELGEALLARSSAPWKVFIERNLAYMKNHAGVINRFGRFPHRNKVLNRTSTPEEIEHLTRDNRSFGQ